MGEWPRVRLGDVCRETTVGHVGPMADKYIDEGVPFLRSLSVEPFRVKTDGLKFIGPEFHAELKKSALRPGDVVIVRTGKPGACAVVPDWLGEANCSDLVIARCGPRLRPRFLSYVVNSVGVQHIEYHLVGAVQQHFNVGSARSLEFGLPEITEQDLIVELLGSIDDKIDLNRRMNETLEAMAGAISQDWFVDFGPVRTKLERREPYLPLELWDLFPDRLVDSELGKIPEGWEVKALGDVIEVHDSRRVPLNSRQRANRQGAYPYYGAAGIVDYVDDFLFDGVYGLIGEDGSVVDAKGYPVVQYVWGQFWVNNHAHVLKGKNGFSEEHLYLLLQQVNITAFVTGAVQPKLSQKNLKSIPFVFPGSLVCQAFSCLVDSLFKRLRSNADEVESLAAQRDALLPKLVSGEVLAGSSEVPEGDDA